MSSEAGVVGEVGGDIGVEWGLDTGGHLTVSCLIVEVGIPHRLGFTDVHLGHLGVEGIGSWGRQGAGGRAFHWCIKETPTAMEEADEHVAVTEWCGRAVVVIIWVLLHGQQHAGTHCKTNQVTG